MKAIRVNRTGGPDVLHYEDCPRPDPGPGEVLVRTEAAGVNFIDVYRRTGQYPVPLPFTIGQEGAGTVAAVGPGVRDVREGDRVAHTGILGSYAEYQVVPAARVVPVPEGVSSQQAAALILQGCTAHYLACSTYPLGPDDTCLVHAAAGGVGLLLCQIARLRGARVIGTVSTEEKATLAREAGATDVIRYTEEDFEAEVKRLTEGRGVHVVYDSVGRDTFEKGLNVLALRGMMVLYGQSSGAVPPFDPQILNRKGSLFLTRPTLIHYTHDRAALLTRAREVFNWVRNGQLTVRIWRDYPLEEAAQAHRDLESRKTTGKLILKP